MSGPSYREGLTVVYVDVGQREGCCGFLLEVARCVVGRMVSRL